MEDLVRGQADNVSGSQLNERTKTECVEKIKSEARNELS